MMRIKRGGQGEPLWRIAGYIYETVISGSVTIFSAKGNSLMSAPAHIKKDGMRLFPLPSFSYSLASTSRVTLMLYSGYFSCISPTMCLYRESRSGQAKSMIISKRIVFFSMSMKNPWS